MFNTSKILSFPLLLMLTASVLASFTLHSGDTRSRSVRWNSRVIKIAISSSFDGQPTNISVKSDIQGAIRRSLATWESVSDIRFEVVDSDLQSISRSGSAGDGVNLLTIAATPENALVFSRNPEDLAASTRVFYDRHGNITEADVALNPYSQFSTDGIFGTYDLESAITHEIGHLLGLEHSVIPGSTMYEHYGRNGSFGLPNFGSRTLSSIDIAALRGLYGSVFEDEECCGTVSGNVVFPNDKITRGGRLWLENVVSGEITAAVSVVDDGAFELKGIPAGLYRIVFRDAVNAAAGVVDNIELSAGQAAKLTVNAEEWKQRSEFTYIGLNGELSDQPVTVHSGQSFRVFMGGANFDPNEITIDSSSPHIEIDGSTLTEHNYGRGIVVFSIDVFVSPETPAGLYTISMRTADGERRYLPGGLAVEPGEQPRKRGIPPVYVRR